MRDRFEKIYERNEWHYGSGEGSLHFHNVGYIAFLEGFIANNNVASVVDLGCGDWQFSQFVNWGEAHYSGYDIVRPVIAANKLEYSDNGVEFHLYSGDPSELPAADLLIAKDVLPHLSNTRITAILSNLDRFKYALITNSLDPDGETRNKDIRDGDWWYLDIRQPPFNIAAEEVFVFTKKQLGEDGLFELDPTFKKNTLLVRSSRL